MAQSRPNIVFIITDQMRGDCLGILGHPVVETPNLDMLAQHGVLFTAAYSSCPSCIAARASVFTGQRPTTHGRIGYRDCVPWRYETTLAGELARAGYQTQCIGKTHFFPQRHHLGFHGLESYEGGQSLSPGYVNDYQEWLRERTGGQQGECDHGLTWNSWNARPSHLPEHLHNNTWVITRGLEFLRRRDTTRPFFLNLSFHRPHAPLDPPQIYYDRYRDKGLPAVPVGDWAASHNIPITRIDAWHGRLAPELLDHARRAYYAQIAHIDNQIGRFMLEFRHYATEPTWFVFTSDHGEMLGDHDMFRKTYAYEGSAKIPLIVTGPAKSHRVSNAPVSLEDMMPTMLEIAGVPIPASVEGRSVLPLMNGTPMDAGWRSFLHGEHAACYSPDSGVQYVTDGREKFIWYTTTGREQFFDLTVDPQECHDLIADPASQERVTLWRRRLIDELRPRAGDSLTDGKRLISGVTLPTVRPELLETPA